MPTPMKDLQQRITRAADFTWQEIGDDILTLAEVRSLPKADVIEAVMDCDYLERYGDDKEAVAAFRKLPADEQLDMLRKAFRCKHYGF